MNHQRCAIPLLLTLCLAVVGPAALAQELGDISTEFKDNLERLQGYTWKSKVRFALNGKLKSTRIFQVLYTPDGSFERTLLEEERKGSAGKEERMAEMQLSSIRSLIDGYTHMKPETFRKAFADDYREVSLDEKTGLHRVDTVNFIARGDKASAWVTPDDYKLRRLDVDSMRQGVPVMLVAEFEDLPNGPTYTARSTLTTRHKKKAMRIETENYEFVAPGR